MQEKPSLKNLLDKAYIFLKDKQVADWKFSAEEIFADFLNLKKNELFLHLAEVEEKKVSPKVENQIFKKIKRRGQREPLQYLVKTWPFYNVNLKLAKDVLIPRPETEYLVDLIVGKLKLEKEKSKNGLQGRVLWDLCTGSGAIAIALKKKFPDLKVIASDISLKTLKIAQKNALLNQVQIEFVQGDLFQPFSKKKKADFIVCNPPYVSEKEYKTLEKELFFEPKTAFVGGVDGLTFYKRLAAELNFFLKKSGFLFLEIGLFQEKSVKKLFELKKNSRACILNDLTGRKRFFFVELQ